MDEAVAPNFSAKQFSPGSLTNGYNGGMLDLPLNRYRVESRANSLRAPDSLKAIPAMQILLED